MLVMVYWQSLYVVIAVNFPYSLDLIKLRIVCSAQNNLGSY
jgi:hypothetical protein